MSDELDPAHISVVLVDVLAPVLGGVEIGGLQRLKGGYSRQMWSFDARVAAGDGVPLILCVDTVAGIVGAAQTLDRQREAALLHALCGQGVAVPDVLGAAGASSALGRAFFVMERGTGTAAVGPLRSDPWYVEHRADLGRQLAMLLATIHAADVPAGILPAQPDRSTLAAAEVTRWSAEIQSTPAARTPVVERAMIWLDDHHAAPPPEVTLVHGDYRTGNILHGVPDGLHTVLDWEMARYGDPVEDVAWAQLACWRVGTGRVGGLVPLDEWPALYTHASGRAVDPDALRFWEVLGSVKMITLIGRAATVVTDVEERALLQRLAAGLGHELEQRLLHD